MLTRTVQGVASILQILSEKHLGARQSGRIGLNCGAMKFKFVTAVAVVEGVILLGILAVSVAPDFFSLPSFGCDGTLGATAPSPDKKFVAYAFERDCGATTGFSTFVILRSAGETLDLTKDLNRDEIVFQADGDLRPQLQWLSAGKLQISFPLGAPKKDVTFQVVKWWDYDVEYRNLK